MHEAGYTEVHQPLCKEQVHSAKKWERKANEITDDMMRLVDRQMEADDETTPHQLHTLLSQNAVPLSLSTIL